LVTSVNHSKTGDFKVIIVTLRQFTHIHVKLFVYFFYIGPSFSICFHLLNKRWHKTVKIFLICRFMVSKLFGR
jgi:hypothetical protein